MTLTYFHPETRGYVENKSNSPVNIKFSPKYQIWCWNITSGNTDRNHGVAVYLERYVLLLRDMLRSVFDVIFVSTSRMFRGVAAVVIVILNVRWCEHFHFVSESCDSFLETSQMHEHNSVEVQKNPDYEMWNEQVLSSVGEDPD